VYQTHVALHNETVEDASFPLRPLARHMKRIVTMTSLQRMGEAQIAAVEGQQLLARAVASVLQAGFRRVVRAMTRHAPAALQR